jgi:hypothetical protein
LSIVNLHALRLRLRWSSAQKQETIAMTSPYVFALMAALTAVVFSSLTMLLLR